MATTPKPTGIPPGRTPRTSPGREVPAAEKHRLAATARAAESPIKSTKSLLSSPSSSSTAASSSSAAVARRSAAKKPATAEKPPSPSRLPHRSSSAISALRERPLVKASSFSPRTAAISPKPAIDRATKTQRSVGGRGPLSMPAQVGLRRTSSGTNLSRKKLAAADGNHVATPSRARSPEIGPEKELLSDPPLPLPVTDSEDGEPILQEEEDHEDPTEPNLQLDSEEQHHHHQGEACLNAGTQIDADTAAVEEVVAGVKEEEAVSHPTVVGSGEEDPEKTSSDEVVIAGDAAAVVVAGEEAGNVERRPEREERRKVAAPGGNAVIEEAAGKLSEKRKNRVLALVGAFETVISLQEPEVQHVQPKTPNNDRDAAGAGGEVAADE